MSLEFYQDTARKLLIYRPADLRVGTHIPDTLLINGNYMAVPQTLYNSQLLAWLNYPVAPVMEDYDWPHNPTAFPAGSTVPTYAQRIMANFMVTHPRCFNLSDMGTMKTLASLWAADFIMQQFPPGECRCLIIAKLSTLQRTWGDAIFNHFMRRRTYQIVHHSDAKKRLELLAKPADFYIVNPDGLKVGATVKRKFKLEGFAAALFARNDIKITIIDEAAAFRDRRSARSRITQAFTHHERMPYVWPMTGTPTPHAPTDAYGLAMLVNEAQGISYTDFHRKTMVQVSNFKWMPAKGGYEEAARLLQPSVRFNIKDVWDGPPMTITLQDVPLSKDQDTLLRTLKRECAILVRGKAIKPANEAAMRTKILQIVQGAVYDGQHASHPVGATPRINEVLELINEATRKVLIFVSFTNVINMLITKLTAAGVPCIKINGETKGKTRDELLSAFKNDPTIRVAVCDPQTVAEGLNEFVAATTTIWYGPTDKTLLWSQGNARVRRPGQTFPVSVVQLAATSIEREIYRRLEKNESMQGVLLNWIEGEGL